LASFWQVSGEQDEAMQSTDPRARVSSRPERSTLSGTMLDSAFLEAFDQACAADYRCDRHREARVEHASFARRDGEARSSLTHEGLRVD